MMLSLTFRGIASQPETPATLEASVSLWSWGTMFAAFLLGLSSVVRIVPPL